MTIPLINLGLYQNIQGEWVQAPGVCKFYDLREAPKNDQIGELVSFPQLQKNFISHIASIFNIIHLQREL